MQTGTPRFKVILAFTVGLLSLAGLAGPVRAAGAPSWEEPFFSLSGKKLVAAANGATLKEKGNISVLLDEGSFSFDNQGRCTTRFRLVYRIMNETGLERWSNISSGWSPWHQERPVLRARVVTPDGVEHLLSPQTVSDAPEREDSPELFTDRRVVRAPLPATTVGAVVEEEVTTTENSPYFAGGQVNRFVFGRSVITHKTRLTLEFPTDHPVKYVVRLLPEMKPDQSEENGRTRLVFETGALEADKPIETDMPADLPRWPEVAFTTGRSWGEVATEYGKVVDRQLGGSDISPLVRKLIGDTNRREIIVEKLLAYVRNDIRYSGIEFGNGTIVPRLPEATLEQGYGDCKDKATLLVKMLRGAAVPCFVALIRAGSADDVDPALPGLGAFDHAIVYIPGSPSLWIDPTNQFRPAGELPLEDQGRWAMIAGPGFPSLIATTASKSQDNREMETREFFLAEDGPARVIETTRAYGAVAAGYRDDYSAATEQVLRKQMEKYINETYRASKLDDLKVSDLKDPARPVTIRLEMKQADRGFTDDKTAAVAISPSIVTTRLPGTLIGEEKEGRQGPDQLRVHDFQLPEPHICDIRYRIIPPPGYRVQSLPDSGAVALGTMTFTKEFAQEADGSVTGRLRLDTGKRRLTAAEFEATKKAVMDLRGEDSLYVLFEHTGQALIAAGKVREALAEFRRLIKLHPEEALHRAQLAHALIKLGMGSEARKEAERAVDLEPDSYLAHRTLAYVLQHDLVGRLRGKGFDRKRAIAEYRQAKKLNPADLLTRADLAILLEFDDSGRRYSPDGDLAGAIREYQAIRKELKKKEFDSNLVVCLLKAGRWKDLRELALALEPTEGNEALVIAATAVEKGTAAALKEARSRVANATSRQSCLDGAAIELAKHRLYRDAALLLDEAAKGSPNAATLKRKSATLKKVKLFDTSLTAAKGPTSVFDELFAVISDPKTGKEAILSLFSQVPYDELKKESGKALDELVNAFKGKVWENAGGSERYLAEVAAAVMDYRVEGDDRSGYRIDATGPGVPEESRFRLYVVREKGRYRILAAEGELPVLALEALARLDRGDLDGAGVVLNWARDEITATRGDDPLGEHPFRLVWGRGGSGGSDGEAIRLASAVLLSKAPGKWVIPYLVSRRGTAKGDTLKAIDEALLVAYAVKDKDKDLIALSDRLAASYPASRVPYYYASMAVYHQRRWDELQARATRELQRDPKNTLAVSHLARCASRRGDFELSARLYRTLDETGLAGSTDYNELAWLGLFRKADLAESVKYGERAVTLSGGKVRPLLHTLSSLYAEAGKPSEARETIIKSIDGDDDELEPGDWYVFGRIAEEYGEIEEAKADYRNVVEADPGSIIGNISCYVLAQKRLAQMEGR
ncbi:hypothetical protein GMSM_10190 [Geomonas sp. Red276]